MNKIGEYMAFGKPIVAFDLTETRVTAQGGAVYAVPNAERDFAERMLELLHQERRRREMGEIARWRVESRLAWVHSVPHLLDAYHLARSDKLQPRVEPTVQPSTVRPAATR